MNHSTRVYESIFEMMPTEENPSPLVRINRLAPTSDMAIFAKLEWLNPFGSVKDRCDLPVGHLRRKGEVRLLPQAIRPVPLPLDVPFVLQLHLDGGQNVLPRLALRRPERRRGFPS